MAPVHNGKFFLPPTKYIETTTLNTGANSSVISQLVLCSATLEITCALFPLRSHTLTYVQYVNRAFTWEADSSIQWQHADCSVQ